MKLVVAVDGNNVSRHFGHCQAFKFFTIEDGEIKGTETIANPGHKKGFLPLFLDEQGANLVISGGMGQGAVDIFNSKGIDVITGAQGDADQVAKSYIAGTLVSTGSICQEHHHSDSCGEH